jgi:predicted Zn-dependent protease
LGVWTPPALKGDVIIKIAIAAACALLGACASTAPGGRSQLVAPTALSSVYSSIDMNLQLATAPDIATACKGTQCKVDQGFDRQVKRIGARLAESAYATHPDLKDRIPAFDFVVAEKSGMGTASDTNGTVVIYRAVRSPRLDESALAFLIAREMGHVIARHHDEKSAVAIVAAVLVHLLMPVTNLAGGAAFLAGAAASTAGAKAVSSDNDPRETEEATAIAMDLLLLQGWRPAEVGKALSAYAATLADSAWRESIKQSLTSLDAVDTERVLLALDP